MAVRRMGCVAAARRAAAVAAVACALACGSRGDPEGPLACSGTALACGTSCVDPATDADHCGRCGHSCQGGDCIGGACQPVVLAQGPTHPEQIAVDATDVYWATGGLDATGAVMKVAKSGGAPVVVVSAAGFFGVAVDSTRVYASLGGTEGAIWRIPLAGGTATVLASGLAYPGYLRIDSANVYFSTSQQVFQVPLGGGTAVAMASGAPSAGVAVDANAVYWTDGASGPNDSVLSMPIAGGPVTTLATAQNYAASLTVDATSVYWTDNGSGDVMKAPLAGGEAIVLASGQAGPWAIAVDGSYVYWTNLSARGGTTVMAMPLGGGTPVAIASNQVNANQLAIDETSVYWANFTAGTVSKVAKP